MTWLKRIRGAVGTGLTWAAGWAVAGVLVGVASVILPGLPWDAFFAVFDAPLPALAVPGFFAGLFFSAVLAVAARRRHLAELSLSRFAALGAIGGLLLTAFPFALVAIGLASREGSRIGSWQIVAVITAPFVLLSAASAAASLLLARAAARRDARQSVGNRIAGAAPSPQHLRAASYASPNGHVDEPAVRVRAATPAPDQDA